MGRGSGEQKIAITAGGGSAFRMGRHGKVQVGIPFTPEKTFAITVSLIAATLVLHVVGRFIGK